jgi:hypothetical protein
MWLGAVYKTSRRQSFFVGVRRVSEQTHPRDNLIDPLCLCRAPMSLTHSEDECPGYQRQTFECPVCGGTMTQWKGVSSARCTTQRKRAANVGVGNPVGAFGCQSLSRASTGSKLQFPNFDSLANRKRSLVRIQDINGCSHVIGLQVLCPIGFH